MSPLIHAVTRKTILTVVFVFALAASVGAAPQRGGGHSGGGRSGGGAPRGQVDGGQHRAGGPRGHVDGGPRRHFGGRRGHFHRPHGRIIIGGGFYDPFWGPYYRHGYGYPRWYPYAHPYGPSLSWYPHGPSPRLTGKVKTEITPKQTEVYVDGYYAGVADDFDGSSRLHTSPGGHAVTLRLDGYRTVTKNISVELNSTYKLTETMEKLAPGEVGEPVPGPALPTGRSDRIPPAQDSGSAPQR